MILFGAWLLFSITAGPRTTVRNLWNRDDFLPHGWTGLVMMIGSIMFSFGGLELVGITAAEADDGTEHPQRPPIPGYLSHPDFLYRLAGGSAFAAAMDSRHRRPTRLFLSSMSWAIRLSPMR